jgi:glutathione synthase/RimK-type ligase-like ATP-grasp enzyme
MTQGLANVRLYSWNSASEGAKQLSLALGIRRLKEKGSTFKGSPGKVVINWGRSSFDNTEAAKCQVVNRPENVARVSNKLAFYELLNGKFDPDLLVPWTKDKDTAVSWLTKPGISVFARTKLTGSGGEGIVEMVADDPESFVKAPLYTRYVPKSDEFRVHVMGGEAILVQRKGLRQTDDAGRPIDPKTANWKIRNLANGFVFVRSDVKPPSGVVDVALAVSPHLGLDFYAADVIWNDKQQRAYVLEVNTAPGLSGSTVADYQAGFRKLLKAGD